MIDSISPIVETRIRECSRWVRRVTAVPARAKTGHDWEGQWLRSRQLVDLPVGTLVAECDAVGSRRHPEDRVLLVVLGEDGDWYEVARHRGREWAYALCGVAREWLALTATMRVRRIGTEMLEYWRRELQLRMKRLETMRALLLEDAIDGIVRGGLSHRDDVGAGDVVITIPGVPLDDRAGLETLSLRIPGEGNDAEVRQRATAAVRGVLDVRHTTISESVTNAGREVSAYESRLAQDSLLRLRYRSIHVAEVALPHVFGARGTEAVAP
jgi:hypothetical protein